MAISNEERQVLIEALDVIERQPDQNRKIAALRTFARCVQGLLPDPADLALLKMPKNVHILMPLKGKHDA